MLKQSKIEDNKYDVQENHRTIMADHQSYKEVTTFSFHPQDATLSHILFLHYNTSYLIHQQFLALRAQISSFCKK